MEVFNEGESAKGSRGTKGPEETNASSLTSQGQPGASGCRRVVAGGQTPSSPYMSNSIVKCSCSYCTQHPHSVETAEQKPADTAKQDGSTSDNNSSSVSNGGAHSPLAQPPPPRKQGLYKNGDVVSYNNKLGKITKVEVHPTEPSEDKYSIRDEDWVDDDVLADNITGRHPGAWAEKTHQQALQEFEKQKEEDEPGAFANRFDWAHHKLTPVRQDAREYTAEKFDFLVMAVCDDDSLKYTVKQTRDNISNLNVSASYITRNKQFTYNDWTSGFIIRVPESGIYGAYPRDTGFKNDHNKVLAMKIAAGQESPAVFTREDVLEGTGGDENTEKKHNEIIALGTSIDGKKVEVIGVFVKTPSRISQQRMKEYRELGVPIVTLASPR